MECCKSSTFGIIIGSINLISYIVAIIYSIDGLVKDHNIKNPDDAQQIIIDYDTKLYSIMIVVCLIMGFISALLIIGIVKKRPMLILVWLILTTIGVVIIYVRAAFSFLAYLFTGTDLVTFFILLYIVLISFAPSYYILRTIHYLFLDIDYEQRLRN